MNSFKKTTSCLLVFSLLLSVISIFDFTKVSAGETAEIYYSGDYYKELGGLESLATSTDGESVFNDLRALIDYTNKSAELSNGKTIKGTDDYHPSYSSLPDYWQETERKENDTNKGMRMFYTNEYATSGYNREHVWPKSIAISVGNDFGSNGKSGGGSDLHHLRPTYVSDNSMHYHSPYGEIPEEKRVPYYCNDDESKYIVAWVTARDISAEDRIMEPLDSYKGDIARIFAYLVTHYSTLSQVINKALDGGFETLVRWNEIDPVDEYEIYRNTKIEEVQGNRNPFIDCPDLINVIWADGDFTGVSSDSDLNSDTDVNSDTDTNTDTDIDDSKYMSLTEVKNAGENVNVLTKGQVVYMYGSSTVIIENELADGKVESLQVYDKSGISAGKYEINSIVELSGKTSLYNNTIQLSSPTVNVLSKNNTPIKPLTISISEANKNVATYVRFENVTIKAVDSSNSLLTDKSGNSISVYKMAALPNGIDENTLCDVVGATYIYNNTVQFRVQNSSDITIHSDDTDTEIDTDVVTDTDTEKDTDIVTDIDTETDTVVDTDTETDTESLENSDNDSETDTDKDDTLYGDVSGDGYISMVDVVLIQKYIAKLESFTDAQLKAADVDEKFGEVNMIDIVCIQKYCADLIDSFPVFRA